MKKISILLAVLFVVGSMAIAETAVKPSTTSTTMSITTQTTTTPAVTAVKKVKAVKKIKRAKKTAVPKPVKSTPTAPATK